MYFSGSSDDRSVGKLRYNTNKCWIEWSPWKLCRLKTLEGLPMAGYNVTTTRNEKFVSVLDITEHRQTINLKGRHVEQQWRLFIPCRIRLNRINLQIFRQGYFRRIIKTLETRCNKTKEYRFRIQYSASFQNRKEKKKKRWN